LSEKGQKFISDSIVIPQPLFVRLTNDMLEEENKTGNEYDSMCMNSDNLPRDFLSEVCYFLEKIILIISFLVNKSFSYHFSLTERNQAIRHAIEC
jgi:hypothetical protein